MTFSRDAFRATPLVRRFRAECLLIDIAGGSTDLLRGRQVAAHNGGADSSLSQAARKFRRQLVKVEVDPREVDLLIDRGYLEPKDRDDPEVLAAAVTACFSDALMTL